jgi:hypothetical protein
MCFFCVLFDFDFITRSTPKKQPRQRFFNFPHHFPAQEQKERGIYTRGAMEQREQEPGSIKKKQGALSSALTASLKAPPSSSSTTNAREEKSDFDRHHHGVTGGVAGAADARQQQRRGGGGGENETMGGGGIPIHRRTNNYGDSARGRHGREYFDDDENGKSIGRQHGSFNYIEKFADVNDIEAMGSPSAAKAMSRDNNSYFRRQNSGGGFGTSVENHQSTSVGARTIPQVHVYAETNAIPISRSFENLEVGTMCGSPHGTSVGGQPSSPVIVVHTKEMDEDAGNVGLAGGRNRSRSFSSLLLLEAQEIRAGSVGNSPRQSRLSEA